MMVFIQRLWQSLNCISTQLTTSQTKVDYKADNNNNNDKFYHLNSIPQQSSIHTQSTIHQRYNSLSSSKSLPNEADVIVSSARTSTLSMNGSKCYFIGKRSNHIRNSDILLDYYGV